MSKDVEAPQAKILFRECYDDLQMALNERYIDRWKRKKDLYLVVLIDTGT